MKKILFIIFAIIALNSLYSQEMTHTFSFNQTEKSISLTIKNETSEIIQIDNGEQANANIVCHVYNNNNSKISHRWYSLADKGKFIKLEPHEAFHLKIDLSKNLNKLNGSSIKFNIFLSYITESYNMKSKIIKKTYNYTL